MEALTIRKKRLMRYPNSNLNLMSTENNYELDKHSLVQETLSAMTQCESWPAATFAAAHSTLQPVGSCLNESRVCRKHQSQLLANYLPYFLLPRPTKYTAWERKQREGREKERYKQAGDSPLRAWIYFQIDAYTDSCEHQECLVVLFIPFSRVHLENVFQKCAKCIHNLYRSHKKSEVFGCPHRAYAYTLWWPDLRHADPNRPFQYWKV